jgi:DNA-binding CsgD family transcriptional regulator
VAAVRDSANRIERLSGQGLDVSTFRGAALDQIRSVMTVDAAFFATVDPATLLFTSAYADAPLAAATPLFLDNEYGQADVNKFAGLARLSDPVGSLDRTALGRAASSRYRQVLQPMGLGDEVRVALVSNQRCWGVLCLHRQDAAAGFDDTEIGFLRSIGPVLADGLRRGILSSTAATQDASSGAPGIVVLGPDMTVKSTTAQAQRWLADIVDTEWTASLELPLPVYAAAALASTQASPDDRPAMTRLRRASGGWLTLHAAPLHGEPDGRPDIVVVIEPTAASQHSSLLLAAYGLTPAQSRVVELVLQGRSTRQIMAELHISTHTVQEHLHVAFTKLGIGSRRELITMLSGQHH